MQIEYQKVIVRAVVVEREDGQVVGERVTQEVALFTEEQLADYIPRLKAEIDAENQRLSLESDSPED